jgi:GTP-binding protein
MCNLLEFKYGKRETVFMFLDEATIDVTGGSGGHGCVSWRREKYVAKGGPNGGDGGNGASIYIKANNNTDTLSNFASKKKYRADDGRAGQGSNKHGRSGEDLYLYVPPGTIITEVDDKNKIIPGGFNADLSHPDEQVLLVSGGRGGFGNAHFKSSTRQRPDFAEKGEPGEHRSLKLELRLVADVGIIGFPSAGKSTLISVISAAKPKIADYEFTTIVPNLGVVQVDDRSYVACDVPGLIEGAHEGKGLGHQFLRHIERCGLLVHMLDVSRALQDGKIDASILVQNYNTIRQELASHSPALASKREIIVLNKIDLIPNDVESLISDLKKNGLEIFLPLSSATTEHVDEFKKALLPIVLEERELMKGQEPEEEELQVLKPHLQSSQMGAYRIDKYDDGSLHIYGKRLEQLTVMTNFDSESAVRRFRDVCERIGLVRSLKREINDEKTPIYIGDIRVNEHL